MLSVTEGIELCLGRKIKIGVKILKLIKFIDEYKVEQFLFVVYMLNKSILSEKKEWQ